jgi:hypothetical protein
MNGFCHGPGRLPAGGPMAEGGAVGVVRSRRGVHGEIQQEFHALGRPAGGRRGRVSLCDPRPRACEVYADMRGATVDLTGAAR